MLSAMIFDIERNSYVDGPGIRTAVFFKGCPLSCVWCHNPESQSFEKQMMFYKSKCIGCGKCREVCPNHLQSCDFCGRCELYCPADARKICGKEYTIDEVLKEIIRKSGLKGNISQVINNYALKLAEKSYLKEKDEDKTYSVLLEKIKKANLNDKQKSYLTERLNAGYYNDLIDWNIISNDEMEDILNKSKKGPTM